MEEGDGEKRLRVNMEKTKVMISGEQPMIRMENGRCPCRCCERGVEENSVWFAGSER